MPPVRLRAWTPGVYAFSLVPLVLVHGEDRARAALAGELGQRDGIEVGLARPGMVVEV